ncbi:suppressor of fused domain protein [Rugamonas sp.]|uniref:suppressor of fused domain protein n=1 Tax=Rugamonas sp. TaxID=1926287 RepID=UPI0025E07A7F|nr:suppressor of fused domain protein [Rugamonas sp.]
MQYIFDKAWLLALEIRFGTVSEIREVGLPGRPKMLVYYFADLPQNGMTTAITSGLSSAEHPDWKFGRPELMITMKSSDHLWGKAIGYFASAYAGDKPFSYGDRFKLDFPISGESDMNACFVFQPSFLPDDEKKFVLTDRTIFLAAMIPLYEDEIETFGKMGSKEFIISNAIDFTDPKREHVAVTA